MYRLHQYNRLWHINFQVFPILEFEIIVVQVCEVCISLSRTLVLWMHSLGSTDLEDEGTADNLKAIRDWPQNENDRASKHDVKSISLFQ
jgi:hypothetical protein